VGELVFDAGESKAGRQAGRVCVTGLFLSNKNTIGSAVDQLTLVLREASRDGR